MGSEGVCSASRWASPILMLEMESTTSAPDIIVVESHVVLCPGEVDFCWLGNHAEN